jgi:hypothetical protein
MGDAACGPELVAFLGDAGISEAGRMSGSGGPAWPSGIPAMGDAALLGRIRTLRTGNGLIASTGSALASSAFLNCSNNAVAPRGLVGLCQECHRCNTTGDPAKGDPGGEAPRPRPLIYWGDLSVTGNGDLPLATQRRVESVASDRSPLSAWSVVSYFLRYLSSTSTNKFLRIPPEVSPVSIRLALLFLLLFAQSY